MSMVKTHPIVVTIVALVLLFILFLVLNVAGHS